MLSMITRKVLHYVTARVSNTELGSGTPELYACGRPDGCFRFSLFRKKKEAVRSRQPKPHRHANCCGTKRNLLAAPACSPLVSKPPSLFLPPFPLLCPLLLLPSLSSTFAAVSARDAQVSHDHELHQDLPEAPQPGQGDRQHQEAGARPLRRCRSQWW